MRTVAKRAQSERDAAPDLQLRRLRGGVLSRRPAPLRFIARPIAAMKGEAAMLGESQPPLS
ncbi:MAG: hypothetical protein Q8R94_20750, partial [Phenylobacterium sp.]|nr:hypothetical protein [Phenylobacterium sp.]